MARPRTEKDVAEARALKSSALLESIFNEHELALFKRWSMAGVDDDREAIHAQYRAYKDFKRALYDELERLTT